MAKMEKELGRTVCKIEKTVNGKRTLKRIPLTELHPDQGDYEAEKEWQCGIFCELAESKYLK